MHVEIVQHVSFEGPGVFAIWADVGGHSLHCTHLYRGERLPPNEEVDLAVIMGGPMSIHDETEFPWLPEEKSWVRERLETGKLTAGVCLGSQIIASQLGAEVKAATMPEIGWFPVERVPHGSDVFADFPERLSVLHWHRECHELPADAVRIAASRTTPVQAFDYRGYAIGLQFHLETGHDEIEKLCGAAAEDTTGEGAYIQSVQEIRKGLHNARANHEILYGILNRLTADRASHGSS